MRIVVRRERCTSAGMCALTAPELFDQSEDDGRVLLADPDRSDEHRAEARRAVRLCPSGAISTDEPEPSTREHRS
ncbi:ferredoxin [Actinomadura spongiicola]|uniref:Ferredoxin n=1 Tax=Actinomadura spongiicola TaxID=2303421 RepID=A0A372GMJ8_9ACTN|nr:ferredoxin [Actinomadura spongiicola]RFS86617.1 ferredoxin [Actinomadura spongiicola]